MSTTVEPQVRIFWNPGATDIRIEVYDLVSGHEITVRHSTTEEFPELYEILQWEYDCSEQDVMTLQEDLIYE